MIEKLMKYSALRQFHFRVFESFWVPTTFESWDILLMVQKSGDQQLRLVVYPSIFYRVF